MHRFKRLCVSIMAFVVVFSFTGAAYAIPVLWTLSDVKFNDGGVAFGTFLYDVDWTSQGFIDTPDR